MAADDSAAAANDVGITDREACCPASVTADDIGIFNAEQDYVGFLDTAVDDNSGFK